MCAYTVAVSFLICLTVKTFLVRAIAVRYELFGNQGLGVKQPGELLMGTVAVPGRRRQVRLGGASANQVCVLEGHRACYCHGYADKLVAGSERWIKSS